MSLLRRLRTIRYLRFRQIIARVLWPYRRVHPGTVENVSRRNREGDWIAPIPKRQMMTGPGEYRILNQEIGVSDADDWNNDSRDKLLLYHLHYFDDLTAIQADERERWHLDAISDWVEQNPPPAGNGWEPYPVSLRIVNWIKWDLHKERLDDAALKSLYLQTRALRQQIENHTLANHLFENAKSLCFAGLFFEGAEADGWVQKGLAILGDQLDEQILPDGGHFELSHQYHRIILEGMLDLANLGKTYHHELGVKLGDRIAAMLRWNAAMTIVDDRPAYFNDSTGEVAASSEQIEAYAERVGFGFAERVNGGITHLVETGYVRYAGKSMDLIADVGRVGPDYQPGHGHCDCLSFELAVDGQRVLVNTGVSTYNECERRTLERGTAAHNTVMFDNKEQSEIWGSFRIGRRARPKFVFIEDNSVVAAHDGYQELGVSHRRHFDFRDDTIRIVDSASNGPPADSWPVAYFHLAPGIKAEINEGRVTTSQITIQFVGHHKVWVESYEYCHGFNRREQASVVCVQFGGLLESVISHANSVHH